MTFCKACEKLGLCTASAMIGIQAGYTNRDVPPKTTPDAKYNKEWLSNLTKLYVLLLEKFPACPNEEYASQLAALKEILDSHVPPSA